MLYEMIGERIGPHYNVVRCSPGVTTPDIANVEEEEEEEKEALLSQCPARYQHVQRTTATQESKKCTTNVKPPGKVP